MKQMIKKLVCSLLVFTVSWAFGQMDQYQFKRQLSEINDQWHKIILPNELFGHISQGLADIRIYGVTDQQDTIEVPYILKGSKVEQPKKDVMFNTINTSHNAKGYYFTFEVDEEESIDEIQLNFLQMNFDWRIMLEGSQDQNEWFTVLENYRILSIKKNDIDFQFTTLRFPHARYRFFRLRLNSDKKPRLKTVSIAKHQKKPGKLRTYDIGRVEIKDRKSIRRTEIDVDLAMPVRISQLKIGVSNSFDYYRPVTIQYVSDSAQTEKGWRYSHRTLARGILNSLDKSKFTFPSATARKLRILIDNNDNMPLSIDSILVQGYVHELIARFAEQSATYFLAYGTKRPTRARYDIAHFMDLIPEKMNKLDLGDEQLIVKNEAPKETPLFENETWLWAIMALIIIVLGWFSMKMIRQN